jgi:membrane-bound lytic murein transglycosylase D
MTAWGAIIDTRIDMAQAEAMANRARIHTSFPITLNPQVLVELNQLLGTPAGRDFMRQGLRRMHLHEAVVLRQLQQLNLPPELLAVPLVESDYKNPLPRRNHPEAGIWQLRPRAARASGLTVDHANDERMNPALESQAAGIFLSGLFAELGDWRLAVLGYNAGASFVERSIRKAGTRDAFRLTQLGYMNHSHYLARVMAVIIIMKNEGSLELTTAQAQGDGPAAPAGDSRLVRRGLPDRQGRQDYPQPSGMTP